MKCGGSRPVRVSGAKAVFTMKSLILTTLAGACVLGVIDSESVAQTTERLVVPTSVRPEAATLLLLQRRIPATFDETRLEDVFKYIKDATGAELEILWIDEKANEGFNKDTPITIASKPMNALALIERIVKKVETADSIAGGATWQMAESGAMQIGPKSRLNRFKRVAVYPIEDLLVEVPDFKDAPNFNLQSVLQAGQGGGQSPFQDGANEQEEEQLTREEKIQEIVDIITKLVEPEQWVDNGGDGATLTPFRGDLIVDAPDYVHRGIQGYPYWSSGSPSTGRSGRWVGISGEVSNSQVDRMVTDPALEPPK